MIHTQFYAIKIRTGAIKRSLVRRLKGIFLSSGSVRHYETNSPCLVYKDVLDFFIEVADPATTTYARHRGRTLKPTRALMYTTRTHT